MKPISEASGRPLKWKRSKPGHFDLMADDEVVAALRCDDMCGLQAIGETADGSWILECTDSFEPRCTVRAVGGNANLATCASYKRGSLLKFGDGRAFLWQRHAKGCGLFVWHTEWRWMTPEGHVLMTIKNLADWWCDEDCYEAEVAPAPEAYKLPEFGLLLLIGWYLVQVHREDEESLLAALLAAEGLTDGLIR